MTRPNSLAHRTTWLRSDLDCWARLYCSGGCAANSYHATGSIGGVYEYGCELFKKRIECAVMMQIAESEEA